MTGLKHLLRDLEELKQDATPGNGGRADELLKRTALFTKNYAIAEYADAESAGVEGADDVSRNTDYTIDGDTAVVTAQGENILFVEFGTGINNNYDSPSQVAGEYGFSPASWSMQNSQWLVSPKSIMFKGKWPIPGTFGQGTKIIQTKNGPKEVKSNLWTEGHPPVDAMYKAFEALKANYPTFAKDIFK